MDRLKLTLVGCGLAALLAAPGCRNLRSEVPAGRPYSSDGRQMPPVGFSSDPHPPVGGAAAPPPGSMGMGAAEQPGMTGQFGTPAPGANANYGTPTNNAYGPPGTSTVGAAPESSGAPSLPPSIGLGQPGSSLPPQ